jgi:hypothetical protein
VARKESQNEMQSSAFLLNQFPVDLAEAGRRRFKELAEDVEHVLEDTEKFLNGSARERLRIESFWRKRLTASAVTSLF